MAQQPYLTIDTIGLPRKSGSSDDLTINSFTAALAGGLNVTSGVSVTNNITFDAVTDTIAGIQNQNLLDKSAAESISGEFTFSTTPQMTGTIDSGNDVVNKDYVDSSINAIDFQESVLDIQEDATLDPTASPATGARYIINDSGALHANFGSITGVGDGDIVEYDGANFIVVFDVSVNTEGGKTWVEDINRYYVYNGSWVDAGGVMDHNSLSGLQGGTTNEYYHLTSTEHTWAQAAIGKVATGGNIVGNDVNDTISANWTITGELDVSGGEFTLPNAVSAAPAEGDTYWDGTTDTLYVYNGSAWVDVANSSSAVDVQNTYTTGAAGVTAGDAVYISANDTVLPANGSAIGTAKVIGFAKTTQTSGQDVEIQKIGTISNLTGLTAGDIVYLDTSTAGGRVTTVPSASGSVIYKLGFAKSATELDIQLQYIAFN